MRSIVFALLFLTSSFLRCQDADSLLQQYQSYPNDTSKIALLFKKGFDLRNSDLPNAIEYAKACYQTAVSVNDNKYLAKALNLRAVLKAQTGLNREAVIDFKRVLQLGVQTMDTLSQAIILNNLGNVYESMKDTKKALLCYENSLYKAQSINNDEWVYGAILGIASLQVKMKLFEQAEGNFTTLLNWADKKREYEIQAICYTNLGMCKFNLGDTVAAEGYQLDAIDVCEMTEDEIGKADAYINLGEIYLAKKNFKESFSNLNCALQITNKNMYTEGLVGVWKALSTYYTATGNCKEALFYLVKHDSALTQNETTLQNNSSDLWETQNEDVQEQTPLFSAKNIFQLLLIGALIIILTIVLLKMSNDQKGQEK